MKDKVRIVLDTNVLVSSLITPLGSSPHRIYEEFKTQKFILLTSISILAEIEDVINRPYLAKYSLSDNLKNDFINELVDLSCVVSESGNIKAVINDPDDDKFVDCAVSGQADYIVSGDKHLLKLHEYQGIRILTPTEFLNII